MAPADRGGPPRRESGVQGMVSSLEESRGRHRIRDQEPSPGPDEEERRIFRSRRGPRCRREIHVSARRGKETARPRVECPSRRGSSDLRKWSTPTSSSGLTRVGGGRPKMNLLLYELHVGTYTRDGSLRVRPSSPTAASRAGGDRDRADARRAVSGREELGLRRRLHLRSAELVRGPERTEGPGQPLPRGGPFRPPRRSLQPRRT